MLWLLFGLTHSILAAFGVKNRFQNSLGGARFYRLGYSLLATGIMGAIIYYTITGPVQYLFTPTFFSQLLAYVLITIGTVLIMISLNGYKPMEFFGLKEMSPATEQLLTKGFNSVVRHPLYLATNVFMLGWLVYLPTKLMLLNTVLYFTYLFIGVYFEEKKLVIQYGQAYKDYQKNVKAFIPYII